MIWNERRRLRSVVGLTFSDGQLSAAHLVQAKRGVEVVKLVSAPFILDLAAKEPEAQGKEIRALLEGAGIGEKNCVVSLPPDWIMSQYIKLPDLSVEDAASFVQMEAEKAFPYDVDEMQLASTGYRSASVSYVTQFAVKKDKLEQFGAVLAAAGLRPVSLTLGLAVVDGVMGAQGIGRVTVAVESTGVTVLIAAGGGIASLRTFRVDDEDGAEILRGDAIHRELRVTLEQLPDDLGGDVREIFLCGRGSLTAPMVESLGAWAGKLGLRVVPAPIPEGKLGEQVAEGMAHRWLTSADSGIEFLAPKPSRWVQLQERYSSKRLTTVGLAVGGILVIALPIIAWQEIHLRILRSQWDGMQAQVTELSDIQDKIRTYRPWNDRTFPDLQILGKVTQCFPSSGSVTAKSVDVHQSEGNTIVSVSGSATDQRTLLRTLEALRKSQEIQDLKVESISGKTASEFNFTFRWIGGYAP